MINLKFCKEKRFFKRVNIFKRKQIKRRLKTTLDYIKKFNKTHINENYLDSILKKPLNKKTKKAKNIKRLV